MNNCNESGNSSEDTQYARFALAVDGYATAVLAVIGFLSNSLCIAVFMGTKNKSIIYCYLLPLSVWDSVLCVLSLLMNAVPLISFGNNWHINGGYYNYTIPFWYALANMTLVGPLWVVLALTIDRYAALCHPFWHLRHMGDRGVVKKRIVIISCLAILYGIPRYFEVNVKEICSKHELGMSELVSNPFYEYSYKITGAFLLYTVVPFCILLTLTVRISIALRRATRKRFTLSNNNNPTLSSLIRRKENNRKTRHLSISSPKNSTSENNQLLITPNKRVLLVKQRKKAVVTEDRTNAMLLAVIVKYLISHIGPTALDMVDSHVNPYGMIQYFISISNFLVLLNSSCTFWIYFAGSASFRHDIQGGFRHEPPKPEFRSENSSSVRPNQEKEIEEQQGLRVPLRGGRSNSCQVTVV